MNKSILILVTVFTLSFLDGQSQDNCHKTMMDSCRRYVINYTPIYVEEGDSLAVPKIPEPPPAINKYLFKCIRNSNYKPLKYSYVLLVKQCNIYRLDHILGEPRYKNNGFLEMARVFLDIKTSKGKYITPYFTCQICEMLYKRKTDIYGFSEAEEILSKD
ncbi:MAG: hypothetical protein K9J21_06485 [Bacteroidales bacterium]|nr:hypothetical protein [Bacteroidales bacterium]